MSNLVFNIDFGAHILNLIYKNSTQLKTPNLHANKWHNHVSVCDQNMCFPL